MNVKRLNELVTQLAQAHTQAEQVLEQYKNREDGVTMLQVNEQLNKLNEIEGLFSIEVGSVVRDYYQAAFAARDARRELNIRELGY